MQMLVTVESTITLSAASLVNRSPTIGEPLTVMNAPPVLAPVPLAVPKPKRRKKLSEAAKRKAAARRKREQRARDAQDRIQITIEPIAANFHAAVRRQAVNAHSITDPALAKAVKAIKTEEPGWEENEEALAAVATAGIDEWSRRWLVKNE